MAAARIGGAVGKAVCAAEPYYLGQVDFYGPWQHGQFKPVNSDRFLTRTTEDIFHFTLQGDVKLNRLAIGVPYADKSNLARHNKGQQDRTVPQAGSTGSRKCLVHPLRDGAEPSREAQPPAGFPIDLPRWCIKLHGRATPLSWTRCAGTGTTLLAAHLEGCAGHWD